MSGVGRVVVGAGRDAIGIIGSGPRARTLARIAGLHGREVLLAREDHAGLVEGSVSAQPQESQAPRPQAELAGSNAAVPELCARAGLIVLAVGAEALRGVVGRLSDFVDGSHLIVHAVRGLEPESLLAPSRVIAQECCVRKIGALLGPALADEWAEGGPNAAVVASRFPEVLQKTQAAFAGGGWRVYSSKDLAGVETAGAATAIVAFSLGICRELALGATAEAMLITRGIAEVSRLCAAMGGESKSAFGLAGLGDLIVQREEESTNVQAGRLFAKGMSRSAILAQGGPGEVFAAIAAFHALAARHDVGARLTSAAHSIAFEELSVPEAVERLVALSHLPE